MKGFRLKEASLVILLAANSCAYAEIATKESSPWSYNASAELSSNGHRTSSYENQITLSLSGSAKYKIDDKRALSISFGGNQEFKRGRKNNFNDLSLSYSKSDAFEIYKNVKAGYSLGLQLPTSEIARKADRYIVLRASLPVSIPLEDYPWSKQVGLSSWSLSSTSSISRSFYKRENYANGGKNHIAYSISQAINLSRDLTDKLSLSLGGRLQALKPFSQSWRAPKYGINFGLGYELPKDYSLSFDYSNGGSIYSNEVGPDQGLSILSRDGSSFAISVSRSF